MPALSTTFTYDLLQEIKTPGFLEERERRSSALGAGMPTSPLSPARDQVLLHLDYLGESAALIEGFAQRAQANVALGSVHGLRADLAQIYRVLRDAAPVLKELEAVNVAASKIRSEAA